MQLLEHFKELTLHPKNAEELKGLILELAVQGKLTQKWRDENPDVEPASELYESIKAEKLAGLRGNKLERDKSFFDITNDQIPFELPTNWIWARLGELGYTNVGLTYKPSDISEDGVPVLRSSNIQDGELSLLDLVRVKTDYALKDIIKEGDLLICARNGSRRLVGKCAIIGKLDELMVFGAFMAIFRSRLNPFIKLFLESPQFRSRLDGVETTTINQITQGSLKATEIPLPPLAEQKAIIEVVNQLFAEVEQLESLTKERIQLKEDFVISALNQLTQAADSEVANHWELIKSQFGTFFTEQSSIKKLREAILQLAVQGKLTHHWRSLSLSKGEPATVLLEKIKAEKEQLIKAGKIKKEKPLPPITEEEIPYDLPEGWVWCRMEEVSDIQRGSSPRPKGDPIYFSEKKTDHNWISIKDISKYSVNNRLMKTDEYLTDLGINYSRFVGKEELIVAVSGSTTGKCCLTGIEGYIYDGLAVIRLIGKQIETEYQLIYMLQLYNHMNDSKFGAAFPNINTWFLAEMLFPFPPLEEQKAIVKKVNDLMSLCDQLEQEIETHHTTQEHWMQSCLREVVKKLE
jgi:type I restriction enzyme S subunit